MAGKKMSDKMNPFGKAAAPAAGKPKDMGKKAAGKGKAAPFGGKGKPFGKK